MSKINCAYKHAILGIRANWTSRSDAINVESIFNFNLGDVLGLDLFSLFLILFLFLCLLHLLLLLVRKLGGGHLLLLGLLLLLNQQALVLLRFCLLRSFLGRLFLSFLLSVVVSFLFAVV